MKQCSLIESQLFVGDETEIATDERLFPFGHVALAIFVNRRFLDDLTFEGLEILNSQ